MVQEDMALCVNCMLGRLTEGSRMLLRWEAKQELVAMTFFFFWRRKVCQHKVISFLSEGEMNEDNLKLRSYHGIFILHVEYSALFCQQTEIASSSLLVCTVCLAASFCLPLSHFKVMLDYISFFSFFFFFA